MAFVGQEEQLKDFQKRIGGFKIFTLVIFFGISIKLSVLQIFKGEHFRQVAEENRIRRIKIPAPRGMIYDRNQVLIVDNQPSFDLEITPYYFKNTKFQTEIFETLEKILNVPAATLKSNFETKSKGQSKFQPVKIKSNISHEEAAQIHALMLHMPGVQVSVEILRIALDKNVTSNLVGYIGKVSKSELEQEKIRPYEKDDDIGKAALENAFETYLRGVNGEQILEVNALGRPVESLETRSLKSQNDSYEPGNNITLTIDNTLQKTAYEAFDGKEGAFAMIDVHTGEILSYVSAPGFDPTELSSGIDSTEWKALTENPLKPLTDKVIKEHFSPGSTFKPITALYAFSKGYLDPTTEHHCNGSFRIGKRVIHCWKKEGHGTLGIAQAIAQSCNVFFWKIANRIEEIDPFMAFASLFGLGKSVNLPHASDTPGLIPTEAWKNKVFNEPWNKGETLSVAIGQSFVSVNAIQVANFYAMIATQGKRYQPQIIKKIESPDGKILQSPTPKLLENISFDSKGIELVKQGLWAVVNHERGSAFYSGRPKNGVIAGKTGTSQVIRRNADEIYDKCIDLPYRFRHHGLFAGFAPYENPKVAFAVISPHSCGGSSGAAPIAKKILEKYFEMNGEKK